MNSKCPYCKEDLRIEMTGQFVEKVDPNMLEMYLQQRERMRNVADEHGGLIGGMMNMAAGMAQGMQGLMERTLRIQMKYPPFVSILRCVNCGATLSVKLPQDSSK